MARPQKQIAVTPEQLIAFMAERQCPKTEVAAALGISTDTFDRRPGYAALYDTSRRGGKAKLREKLFQTAMLGNTQILIFLGKTVLGMKETSALELSGPDGGAIETTTNDPRQRLADLLARSAARGGSTGVPGQSNGD